ncbi:protease III family protein [Nitzschia inconspicua]|uniref:Protease III family protein n=1 Tax=Nitzschia inconspicua TaxID=303405 RepID=A0A9K3LX87_9STRA|nr:protease III family protein [Nitzschia inconspicua]
MASTVVHPLPTPIKGKADWRNYKAFQLENGVTCLVINDKESKTTAMSCVVNVGASADPRSMSGLAHFCEHMCFLGSEKYPGENEYKRYLSSHGGRSNASTSMYVTNYKFEVIAEKAEKAVDIFSNFFVAPLFTLSGTGREVNAVDSENSKNLTADARRRLQILKDLADPQHYYSKFSTGNAKTLPTSEPKQLEMVREALLAFHRRHYGPEKMSVCIAGPQSIETLEDWIVSRYSQIVSKPFPSDDRKTMTQVEQLINDAARDAPPYSFQEPVPPFNPPFRPSLQGSWPFLLTTKPLRSMRKLVMMFPMPSDRSTPDQAPSSMLSHLLGHEGRGSAFAALQNEGLLSALSAGARTSGPDFKLFQVDMTLTEKGEENWETIVDVIFAYCRMLLREVKSEAGKESLRRIWGETSDLNRLFFHQTSPGSAYSYAPNLADSVVTYGTKACLSAGSLLDENEDTCPLEEFERFVKFLTPGNCIIERCSEGAFESMKAQSHFQEGYGLKKEKWYGVEYYLSTIDSKSVDAWGGSSTSANSPVDNNQLFLPTPNLYIPRTLELCPELPEEARKGQRIDKPIDPPNLLVDETKWKLYHRLDDRYALPQSSIHLLIRNIALQHIKCDCDWIYDARTALLSSLVAGIFNEAMAQETYDADLAGLHWSLSAGAGGIKLNCFGFSDRLPDLSLKVLSDFLSGSFLNERFFVSSRDRIVRGLKTYFESQRADSQAAYFRDSLMASQDNGIDESLKFALSLEYEDVVKHHQWILSQSETSVECLASGNICPKDATAFFTKARAMLEGSQNAFGSDGGESSSMPIAPATSIERMLLPGQEIQLHFASKNPEEENGAVLCTYQSSIPSFKGDDISHPESLLSSSAIRLLCHMLREPLFDDLRTKQALGYIVSSYYEIGYSSQSNINGRTPCTTPIDFVSINILSRKMSPQDITRRIDEFLGVFRRSLEEMPESEIQDHADALATKLLKPIQKLQTEASNQYARIQKYGPEVYRKNQANKNLNSDDGMPWETAQSLAATIRTLTRKDIINAWDRMTQVSTRSRIISCVYGKTFPLAKAPLPGSSKLASYLPLSFGLSKPNTTIIFNDFSGLLELRMKLPEFSPGESQMPRSRLSNLSLISLFQNERRMKMFGLGVLGMVAIGSAYIATDAGRRRRSGSGNTKVLASSVFFLVAIAIPTAVSSFVLPLYPLTGSSSNGNIFNSRRLSNTYRSRNEAGLWLHRSHMNPRTFLGTTFATLPNSEVEGFDEFVVTSTFELNRREILQSMGFASMLLPTAALALGPSIPTSIALDDLRFGSSRWSRMKEDFSFSNPSKVPSTVPASFATYLTRFLINYDEGVSSWWESLQHAYSLLPDEQQRSRLGQDFGKMASSVQHSIQEFINEKEGYISSRQAFEQVFERLDASYRSLEVGDEVNRQLLLLVSILPSGQQPKDYTKKQARSLIDQPSRDPNEAISAESLFLMKEDFTALLPSQYVPIVNADGSLSLPSSLKLFEVGIGEEFGQAATATLFGPLASAELTRDLPNYSFDIYALFGISGATGCCLTHSLVIPLDVVKTKEQVWSTEEHYNGNVFTGAKRVLREEGVSGLLTGAQATLAGYFWYGLSVYPSYAFFKRFLSHDVLPVELATSHANDIALVAGALAAVIASLGLTPLEAARIRVVADPSKYRQLGLLGTLKVIAGEGEGSWRNLYAGLPSLLTRQVIFGSVKFLAFERACEFIYNVWPFMRDSTWTSLSVSLVAGGFSGALSSIVSQPADSVLTYVAAVEKSTSDGPAASSSLGVLEGSRLMIEEGGISSLFRGLGSRCLWAAAIIAGQFLLYDVFRNFFGVNSEDLSQVFRIDLQ